MSETNGNEIHLSLLPKEFPIWLSDAGGNERRYIIREAVGANKIRWRGSVISAMGYGPDGARHITPQLPGTELELISYCLHDDQNKPVPFNVIQQFPAHITDFLYKKAKELTDPDETPAQTQEQAKNLPTATPAGSA